MKRAAGVILMTLLTAGVTSFAFYRLKTAPSAADLPGEGCQISQASSPDDRARLLTPSALVSDRSLAFYSVLRTAKPRTLALGYKDASEAFHPTAFIVDSAGTAASAEIVIPGGKCPAIAGRRYDLSAIEQLYTLALTLDPLQQFSLAICGNTANCVSGEKRPLSHAALLGALVAQRQLHAEAIGPYQSSMPRWSPVEITQLKRVGHDEVSIKLSGDRAAFEGASVAFSRRPHAGCIASIDAQGVAACVIEDSHGDEHLSDEENGPVIATYSGKVLLGITYPPTTGVIDKLWAVAVP
ncbi:hypothetical protein J2W28_006975 [Variovorax boronicumulans]|uniref:hypothetical protein n=1 Tax=Variovorax boronicumulans TaxID=436515 RepID=UPI002781D805|nr:hypothetical protein [Variovorax boronicumulans]MDP9996484.1 hypothetical protein [Variovorax boronicumulans]MDQ0007796.1 hypothetical protein [Variovorax boronicumulans]